MHLAFKYRFAIRSSFLALATCASPAFAQIEPATPSTGLDDIVVTARKRTERLQDVPIAITALTAETLQETGADRFEDYLALSPGVNFAGTYGNNAVTIRGISTALYSSNTQSTIEVLFDDLPSLNRYYSRFSSDMRLVDVERVEVLRGPQGTLFGSGALGGAIRIINAKPDAGRFSASAEAGLSSVKNGGTGHDLKAMVNIPIATDKLALRVVGYDIREAGFIDNIVRNEKNVNDIHSTGVRAALSYTPTDRLTLTGWVWHQRDRTGGDFAGFLNPANGGKYQSASVDPEDAADDKSTLYNLTAKYELGGMELLSSTSYVDRNSFSDRDYTTFWQQRRAYLGDVEDTVSADTRMFNQEVRLASSGDGPLRWLVGGYYLKQDVSVYFLRTMAGFGAAKKYTSDTISSLAVDASTREIAAFGEASYTLFDKLTLTAGARWFDNKLEFASERGGFEGGAPTPPRSSKESAVTPKFAIAFLPSRAINIYAQASKGYRTGQNNFVSLADPATGQFPPEAYGPDSLWNYEIGFKASLFDQKLRLNVAAFHIDWKNVQLTRRNSISTYTDNTGDARSRGVEVELTVAPTDGLTFGVSPAYTKARLVSVLPGATVQPGDLPGSPKWSVSDFIQASKRFGDEMEAFVRLDHRYVGSKRTQLEVVSYAPAGRTDAYHLVNLRIGATIRNYEANLFVDNLTNNDASLAPRILASTPDDTIRQRPRTIGALLRFRY